MHVLCGACSDSATQTMCSLCRGAASCQARRAPTARFRSLPLTPPQSHAVVTRAHTRSAGENWASMLFFINSQSNAAAQARLARA